MAEYHVVCVCVCVCECVCVCVCVYVCVWLSGWMFVYIQWGFVMYIFVCGETVMQKCRNISI